MKNNNRISVESSISTEKSSEKSCCTLSVLGGFRWLRTSRAEGYHAV